VARSSRGVLRGLHFQEPEPQAKLIHVLAGEIFDVAVDLRPESPTFSRWCSVMLSAANGHQVLIPEGFAHGYLVLSEQALVSYKCSRIYRPAYDRAMRWDDPHLGIAWPDRAPILSAKDRGAMSFVDWCQSVGARA
jgi:dTDP-4-dehydrorhamnose 3,5-epimerase